MLGQAPRSRRDYTEIEPWCVPHCSPPSSPRRAAQEHHAPRASDAPPARPSRPFPLERGEGGTARRRLVWLVSRRESELRRSGGGAGRRGDDGGTARAGDSCRVLEHMGCALADQGARPPACHCVRPITACDTVELFNDSRTRDGHRMCIHIWASFTCVECCPQAMELMLSEAPVASREPEPASSPRVRASAAESR